MKEVGSAAAVICQMKFQHSVQALKMPLMKDILGIVATLCRVNDTNLSRSKNIFVSVISCTSEIYHCLGSVISWFSEA
jgi:hypothetical protein